MKNDGCGWKPFEVPTLSFEEDVMTKLDHDELSDRLIDFAVRVGKTVDALLIRGWDAILPANWCAAGRLPHRIMLKRVLLKVGAISATN